MHAADSLWDSGAWSVPEPGWREVIMAGKDKGGRAGKTAAARTPKEKRQLKKDKKAAKGIEQR